MPIAIYTFFLVIVYCLSASAQYTQEQIISKWLADKPVIDSIVIEGNVHFKDSKIRSILFSRKSDIFRAIKADRRRRVQRESRRRYKRAIRADSAGFQRTYQNKDR